MDSTWLMPCSPSEMEISLDTMPQMPTRDRVRRHVPAAAREEILILPLADVDPAAARADDHAGVRLTFGQSGIVPRFARGDDAEQRRA